MKPQQEGAGGRSKRGQADESCQQTNLRGIVQKLKKAGRERQYFPEGVHSFTMESMMKAFYCQDGYVKIRKRKIDVMLHSYDEPSLQKAVKYACVKFNNGKLMTPEGRRIWMHVEEQNVKF